MSSSSSDPSVSPSERAGDAAGSRTSGPDPRSAGGDDSSSVSLDEHALLESIFNASAAAITVLDTDGQIVQANARAEEVLGLSPSAIEGRSYDDPLWEHETLDGDPFPEEKQPFVQVMRTGEPVYDVQHAITWPDGRRRILSIDGAPLRDDDTMTGAVFLVDDITERKRREWALQEEHDRFETLFENLPTPVVHGTLEDEQFTIITVNAAFEEVFGISAGTAQGKNLNTLIVPDDQREKAIELDRQAVQEGSAQTEVRRVTADGLRDFQVQVTVRQREENRAELYTIYTDISERKEMEETLRNREQRLRSITQNISDGIYRSDPNEGIVYANDAFVEMFGYDSLAEVRTVDSTALYESPEERKRLVRIEQEEGALNGEEVTFQRKDGTTFIGLLSSRAIRYEDGSVKCYDGVITDITERKAYEEEMAYRSELERIIVDISTQFISAPIDDLDAAVEEALGAVGAFVNADRSYVFLVDDETETTSNTHEWCDEGIRPHQPDLQNIPYSAMPWFLDKMHRHEPLVTRVPDLPEAASSLQAILEDGNIQSLVVLPMTRGDTLVGFIGFDAVRKQRDWDPETVTILRVLGDAIASALHRKTMEKNLREAKKEAEEASVLKSAMLANMSHEIRTPLTSIVGLSEVLEENLEGDQADLAEIVHKSSQRLKETLTSVLQLSKLEAGAHELEREPVSLAQVADETVKLLHPKAVDQSVDIEATVPDDTPVTGEWDKGALTRIVTNLTENAIKFTPASGTVAVRVQENDEVAVLEVEDSGVGIDEDFLPNIFNAFEQEDGGLNREHEGSGLGLAITKRLTEALGGTIEVESEKGVGTRFAVRLPQTYDGASDSE